MSKFLEVMRQAKRMCKAMGDACIGCPLRAVGECVFTELYGENPEDWAEATVAEIERIVMDWAEKHPEPRYPSWNEGWRQLFPTVTEAPCLNDFGVECDGDCTRCREDEIPADIAEKLRIKPIGGEDNA